MNIGEMLTASLCAQLACIFEVTARKPGNAHPLRAFDDTTHLDFLVSAAAIAPLMDQVRESGVGATVLEGIQRTRQVTPSNTNLGILLLQAPLAAVPEDQSLNDGVSSVLAHLTLDDARFAYQAIRLANPRGLGNVREQDVAQEPTQTLLEVMRLAADRDAVARQYANGYREVFQIGVPALLHGLEQDWPVEEAIIYCHLGLMAACPDTLIARKRGWAEAEESARQAESVLASGWPNSAEGRHALRELDDWLRAMGNQRNPGTTADLVTACLFAALREGTMQVPLLRPWHSSRLM